MLEIVFLIVLGLIWIIFASIQDIKQREVANWLNFSLIIFALGFRFFYSLFSNQGFMFFYQGLIGLGIFFILGNIFYYGRMFAGGDAKLLIALGTILPLSKSFIINLKYFLFFIFLFLIIGAVYGVFWSFILVFKNLKAFAKEFPKQFIKERKKILLSLILAIMLIAFGFFYSVYFYLSVLFFIFPWLWIYAKTIDEVCMIKKIKTKDLTEGDWLYRDIKIGKKTIKATWDGLSKKEINELRKKFDFIKIRQGIQFVPVFLISFLIFAYGILFGSQVFFSLIS